MSKTPARKYENDCNSDTYKANVIFRHFVQGRKLLRLPVCGSAHKIPSEKETKSEEFAPVEEQKITKTRLFKYIENFTTKTERFQIKKK